MGDGYIHGRTDARETARLERQGDWTAAFAFPPFDAGAGQRVLDLGCGVGAMSWRLASHFPGIRLVGVDRSASQLSSCRAAHPELTLVRADAAHLPFSDGSFDRVFASWLLEHVPAPVEVLRAVHRVLARGGLCQFVEVDNFSFITRPVLPFAHEALRRLNAAQARAGGDPGIGQRLHHLLRAAGFSRFTVEPVVMHGTWARPEYFSAFIEEFVGIFESVDEVLGDGARPLLAEAVRELERLKENPRAELRYTAFLAQGFR